MKKQSDKKRGRPPVYVMPEPIPDTPENIAKAILTTPPKKRSEWKFIQEQEAKHGSGSHAAG